MFSFENKTILITGGTGSFGNKTIIKLLDQGFKEIRVFSRDELKQYLMRKKISDSRITFYIGDVRDRRSVDSVMKGVDFVFHAAALKQVPQCDLFPQEAVKTNICGGANVMESAIEHNIQKVICLSTDKAVFPINAMGMSKALMEKTAFALARNLNASDTVISCVRYGNVMYSRGSVIPLFVDQIQSNNAITVTDGNMTRFMMSLEEAVGLVLFALENAKQGDLFIRKSPACTVDDLAIALQNLLQTYVPISTIGIRHGEKIFETLATAEEINRAEHLDDHLRVSVNNQSLDYGYDDHAQGEVRPEGLMDYTSNNTDQLSVDQIETLLLGLPEIKEVLHI